MSLDRISDALDAWQMAEQHRDTLEPGSTEWLVAEAAVTEAHEAYLAMIEQVAAEAAVGPSHQPGLERTDDLG